MKNFTISLRKTFNSKSGFIFLSLFGILISSASAQTILFNNGAQVYTGPAAIVKVNGGFQNDGTSGTTPVFENNGTMTVSNSGTPGSVFLTNASTLQGNGTYLIEQDWTNNATFSADASTVNFNGNLQEVITSTNGTVTTFNNLILSGSGLGNNKKKTLQNVDANITATGTLTINDRELETLSKTMFVQNPSTTCVTNNTTVGSEGFVSSNVGGSLSRATNSSATYLFPTGSSVGTVRYRPVQLNPASASANTYTARLGNNDATTDGFNTASLDGDMCVVNNLFYHQIIRSTGVDNANVAIFYDQPADGAFDGMAQWNTPVTALWNNMGVVTATSGTPFNDVLKVNWADFSNSPYVLSRQKPQMPVLACAPVCPNTTDNVFTATGTGSLFTWTSPAGTTITSGQGTNTVSVDWNAISGPISVTTESSLQCTSNPASCLVSVSIPPVAAFEPAISGLTYVFNDLSSGTPNQWTWDFGDGSSSAGSQSVTHTYTETGPQTVCLTTVNAAGCIDDVCKDIDVTEFLIIPNVFTPDGDGTNDLFYINNSGFESFFIEIYDRWGLKIFESEAPNVKWDGRSTAGVAVTDGTYYYILKAKSIVKNSEPISKQGFVQLSRKK